MAVYKSNKRYCWFLATIFIDDKEIGGVNDDDKLLLRKPWKGEIHTKRYDSSFKYGYVNPKIPYQSLGFR